MKLFKKVSAMVVSLLMALAIVVPVAAANPTITVKNIAADENVTLSYLKVVKQDKTTKTGWAFVDETVAQIFRDEYGKKDDQAILASLANSAAHSKALARLGNLSGFTGFTNNGERKTEVDGAGLYVVKVVDNSNKYTYNVMAAPINFEYANNPATLKNAELAVKRSETRLTKTVNDTDGAVHNGQTVTYTINVKVPSIDPTATNKLFKVTDALTGANGQLVVKGLDKGKYQFKEVTAPEGYSINETNSSATLTITGDKATAEFTADADMRDTEVGALPETGGIGTTIFTVGGCAIMVAAAALFFMNKKKHEK